MADPPSYTGDDTDVGPDRRSATSSSRWVPVIGLVIAVVLVLLVVVLHITGVLGPGAH